jgi:hypothetical protein
MGTAFLAFYLGGAAAMTYVALRRIMGKPLGIQPDGHPFLYVAFAIFFGLAKLLICVAVGLAWPLVLLAALGVGDDGSAK